MGHLLRTQRRLPSGGRPLLLSPVHPVPSRYAASPSAWTPSRYASASGRRCTSPTVAKRALVDFDTETRRVGFSFFQPPHYEWPFKIRAGPGFNPCLTWLRQAELAEARLREALLTDTRGCF